MKPFSYIIALTVVLLLCACGDKNNVEFGEEESNIDIFLENEFYQERPHLKVMHNALAHDFMFYGAFIPMLNSPTGHSLKGRIVRFEKTADRLIMLESPKGHSIGNLNESYILLAEFPIVKTDSDGIIVDFAKGMNTAFTMRNVHSRSTSDQNSKSQPTAEQFRAVSLSASFIRSIETDNGVLAISQIAQWRTEKSELVSAEFRYYFRDYAPPTDFAKKTFGKQRWAQYFSTPPLVDPPVSTPFSYITKWHITKPLVFYLSANTPEKYRDAIKDGVLFWNHIFGKKVIEVLELDPKISAPHPKLNILQWVTWDNEASAYADMVVDHLTGQIVQAQIYIRSGWVIESAKKLKHQLEEIVLAEPEGMPTTEEGVPLPSMFDFDDPCLMTMGDYDSLLDLTAHLSDNDIAKDTIDILTGDVLRTVIAHEMGHVFGLRHNLAGSTAGNITLSERNDILRNYLRTGTLTQSDDKYFSPSIMDVFSAGDDAIVGAQIRKLMGSEDISHSKLQSIYRHDRDAIKLGYLNQAMPGDTPFCTDEDTKLFLDCRRWDASNTPFQFASERLNSMMTQIAIVLADTFISSIDPERKGGALRVQDMPLTEKNVLKIVENYTKELLLWFNKNARSTQIEAQFSAFGPHMAEEITKERFSFMRSQIGKDQMPQFLFAMLPPFRKSQLSADAVGKNFSAHFLFHLASLMEKNPGFIMSKEEQQQAITTATNFLDSLNDSIISLMLSMVAKAQFDDPELQTPIEDALGVIAQEIILSVDNNNNDHSNTQSLPQFRYALATREQAVHILNPALGVVPDWSFDNLTKISNSLKQYMRRFGAAEGAGTIDLNSLPRPQRQWLLEQNRILNSLQQIRSLGRKLN